MLKGSLGAARTALGKLLASDGGGEEEVGVARGKVERLEKAVGESEGEMRGCGLRIVGFEADVSFSFCWVVGKGGMRELIGEFCVDCVFGAVHCGGGRGWCCCGGWGECEG